MTTTTLLAGVRFRRRAACRPDSLNDDAGLSADRGGVGAGGGRAGGWSPASFAARVSLRVEIGCQPGLPPVGRRVAWVLGGTVAA